MTRAERESRIRSLRKRLRPSFLRLDLHGAALPGVDLSRADLREADLRGTQLRDAKLSGTDLAGAKLGQANLEGADLTGVRNLTVEQLRPAIIDQRTILPDYIDRAALAG